MFQTGNKQVKQIPNQILYDIPDGKGKNYAKQSREEYLASVKAPYWKKLADARIRNRKWRRNHSAECAAKAKKYRETHGNGWKGRNGGDPNYRREFRQERHFRFTAMHLGESSIHLSRYISWSEKFANAFYEMNGKDLVGPTYHVIEPNGKRIFENWEGPNAMVKRLRKHGLL